MLDDETSVSAVASVEDARLSPTSWWRPSAKASAPGEPSAILHAADDAQPQQRDIAALLATHPHADRRCRAATVVRCAGYSLRPRLHRSDFGAHRRR